MGKCLCRKTTGTESRPDEGFFIVLAGANKHHKFMPQLTGDLVYHRAHSIRPDTDCPRCSRERQGHFNADDHTPPSVSFRSKWPFKSFEVVPKEIQVDNVKISSCVS